MISHIQNWQIYSLHQNFFWAAIIKQVDKLDKVWRLLKEALRDA